MAIGHLERFENVQYCTTCYLPQRNLFNVSLARLQQIECFRPSLSSLSPSFYLIVFYAYSLTIFICINNCFLFFPTYQQVPVIRFPRPKGLFPCRGWRLLRRRGCGIRVRCHFRASRCRQERYYLCL